MLCLGACAAPAPPAPLPLPTPTPPLVEEELMPIERPKIEILDFTETPSTDRKVVTLVGTLVNHGTRATRAVYVHVEALNTDGGVVLSADSEPSTETIAPGATGRFTVTIENRTDVDRYHIEAISR